MSKTDIPESIMSLVKLYLKPLLVWFSDKVYAELVHQAKDHLLVKLETVFDFAPLETACAGYHHTSGAGTKPIHTVSRLVRALLVKYLFDWSLRQLEFQIRVGLQVPAVHLTSFESLVRRSGYHGGVVCGKSWLRIVNRKVLFFKECRQHIPQSTIAGDTARNLYRPHFS